MREARQVLSNEVKDELKELSKLESLGERNLAFDKEKQTKTAGAGKEKPKLHKT